MKIASPPAALQDFVELAVQVIDVCRCWTILSSEYKPKCRTKVSAINLWKEELQPFWLQKGVQPSSTVINWQLKYFEFIKVTYMYIFTADQHKWAFYYYLQFLHCFGVQYFYVATHFLSWQLNRKKKKYMSLSDKEC